jgi:hypothetical protein
MSLWLGILSGQPTIPPFVRERDIAVAHQGAPSITAYPWDNSTGFGTKYADPATLPVGQGRGVAFSPNGNSIAVAHTSTPLINAYPWSAGFGTKYADPATLQGTNGLATAFSPSGNHIALLTFGLPYISVYTWSAGFGTKYADPVPAPGNINTFYGRGYSVTFSPSGADLALGANGIRVVVYPWNNGFGTKYAAAPTGGVSNPGGGNGLSVDFSPSGQHIAVGGTYGYVDVYPWNNGFGTMLASSPQGGADAAIRWSPSGSDFALATSGPSLAAYPFNNVFGTKYANPSSTPQQLPRANDTIFSPSGAHILTGGSRNTGSTISTIATFNWNNGFGARMADPVQFPTSTIRRIAFSPN